MSTVIDEILDPVADCLTPDVAKRLTELRLNPTTQARIDELAGQANEGLLTPDERAEYADIVEGLDFLGHPEIEGPLGDGSERTVTRDDGRGSARLSRLCHVSHNVAAHTPGQPIRGTVRLTVRSAIPPHRPLAAPAESTIASIAPFNTAGSSDHAATIRANSASCL